MNDLINRRKAIEALKELRKEYRIPLHNGDESTHFVIHFHEAMMVGSEVIGAFDGIIQALECVPPAREWIPIPEKRPEKEGWYLVFYPYDQQYEVARWHFEVAHDYEGFFSVEWASSDDVIAWMPLPEPYEVKE